MNIEFNENEFTTKELLTYMNKAYGAQINGAPFSSYNINNWIRIGKIPMSYGDHRIVEIERIDNLAKLTILTIEGLNREVLEDVELLDSELLAKALPKTNRSRKYRTPLYYKMLAKLGKQSQGKALAVIPKNWKETGIKMNQLPKTKRRKISL